MLGLEHSSGDTTIANVDTNANYPMHYTIAEASANANDNTDDTTNDNDNDNAHVHVNATSDIATASYVSKEVLSSLLIVIIIIIIIYRSTKD